MGLLERALEGSDAVATEGVILRQHADGDVVLAERDGGGQRVLRGIACAAENVAVPFIAGDGIRDRGLDQKDFLCILGDRKHGECRARRSSADGDIDIVVGIGLFQQRLGDVRLALVVLGNDHDLAAIKGHSAAGQIFEAEVEAGLGLLGVSFERPGL